MHIPEFQCLLPCASPRPDAKQVRNLVGTDIDWQVLLKLAWQHGVRPLLFRSLQSACWDAVPAEVRLELERFNRINLQKNLLFTGGLLRVLTEFKKTAIPIAAFKGPVLAEAIYGDLSLREISDVDVVVREIDVHRAEDVLATLGYRADFPDKDFRSAFMSYHGQYAFREPDTGI